MASCVPEQLEVYEPGRSYKDAPNSFVSYAEGLRRVHANEASWCKHNRGIRMHRPSRAVRAGSAECHTEDIERFGLIPVGRVGRAMVGGHG